MTLFALCAVLVKKYGGRKSVYLTVGLISLLLGVLAAAFVYLSAVEVRTAKLTIGEFSYQSTICRPAATFLFSLAVFSLIKGLCPKMKILPLIPSIAASIVVGGAFGLAGSLLYSRAFNMLTLEGAMGTASIFVLVTGILQGAAAGFFAVSWVEYIRTDAPSGENSQDAESGKTTEFSYLDEYKKNMKENGRNV